MQGSLGVGANLSKWSPEDFSEATEMVRQYKSIRERYSAAISTGLQSPIRAASNQ